MALNLDGSGRLSVVNGPPAEAGFIAPHARMFALNFIGNEGNPESSGCTEALLEGSYDLVALDGTLDQGTASGLTTIVDYRARGIERVADGAGQATLTDGAGTALTLDFNSDSAADSQASAVAEMTSHSYSVTSDCTVAIAHSGHRSFKGAVRPSGEAVILGRFNTPARGTATLGC